jgi:threonine dehydrogenase-like Zn-dependent dehydrogenase
MALDTAAFAEPTSTVAHAFSRTGLRNTDRVAVIGTGTLGLIAVQIARAAGAEVAAVGVTAAGQAAASSLGARTGRPGDLVAASCNVVIEASGATDAPAEMLRLLAPAGRAALVGIAHHPVEQLDLATAVFNNATISAVLSGLGHWDSALAALDDGTVRPDTLLHTVVDYTASSDAFALLATADRARPRFYCGSPARTHRPILPRSADRDDKPPQLGDR